MKILQHFFLIATLFLVPFFLRADTYPVNKNIDIKHYRFQLNLSDSADVIYGTAQITILFKKQGLQNFRLDLTNKTTLRQGNGN